MAMQYEGKTYRNLQEQVGYLTRMYQDLGDRIEELRAQIPSKMIVEELPEEGDPLITYYVGPKGTEPNLYYEVWVWVQEEPDGPFVWRELEDTDQVDLSGYLEKNTAISGYSKRVYGTSQSGDVVSQVMLNATDGVYGSVVVLRDGNGQIAVPETPSADGKATSKKYVNDNFLVKRTEVTSNRKAYMKYADGSQGMIDISPYRQAEALVARTANAQVYVPDTPDDGICAINKNYADGTYLAKQTDQTTYAKAYLKNTDGTQGVANATYQIVSGAVVLRNAAGAVLVPLDPFDQYSAVSKKYVDDAVGQLLYLHDIEIIVTVDATNKLWIKAYLINGSSTAITDIDRATFKRMDVQYGAFGPDIANVTTCAVTKCPDSLRQDEFDEPYPAYLYQYMSGGSLVSGATTYAMSVTVTDSVITF